MNSDHRDKSDLCTNLECRNKALIRGELAIVALAKWDSHAAVEDAPREAQVITSAVKDGELKGLDRTQGSLSSQRGS